LEVTARYAGMEWKRNGLRNSYCSYRLALIQNDAQVALESGNSPRMIHQNYKELVTKEQAEAYFSVFPSNRLSAKTVLKKFIHNSKFFIST
jgi:hypothetical protein